MCWASALDLNETMVEVIYGENGGKGLEETSVLTGVPCGQ